MTTLSAHLPSALAAALVSSVDEVRQWLSATGWKFVDHKPLVGPISLLVAEAV